MKMIITPEQDNYLCDLASKLAFSRHEFNSPEFDQFWLTVYGELFYDLTGETL